MVAFLFRKPLVPAYVAAKRYAMTWVLAISFGD
jgi:hypothetical protein